MSGIKIALLLDLFYACVNLSVWKAYSRKESFTSRFVLCMHKSECGKPMSGKTALLLDLVLPMHTSECVESLCQEGLHCH